MSETGEHDHSEIVDTWCCQTCADEMAAYGPDEPFPFPLAEPRPDPVMVTRPCGCTSMVTAPDELPIQVSWCVDHEADAPWPPAPSDSSQD